MVNVGIVSFGYYIPKRILTVEEIANRSKLSVHYLRETIGLEMVHICEKNEQPSDMAIKAAMSALKNSNLSSKDIDLIIFCYGGVKDYLFWSCSSKIKENIEASNAYCFDLDAACMGPLTGLEIAKNWLISNKDYETALIVCADKWDDVIDFKSKLTHSFAFFGDGASAIVIKKGYNKNLLCDSHFLTDSSYWDLVDIPAGGTVLPPSHKTINKKLHFVKVNIKFSKLMNVIRFKNIRVKKYVEVIENALKKNKINKKASKFLIKLQSRLDETKEIIEKINLTADNTYMTMKDYGHLGPSDIFFNLAKSVEQNKIHKKDIVILASVGYGYSWGAMIVKWG